MMGSRFLSLLVGLALVAAVVVSVALPQTAAAVNFFGDACQGSGADSAACSADQEDISGADGIILRAAALLSIVAGIAAVIVIMVGAFMFITAGGDSNKMGTAKKAITFAVIGLIVIFLARTIVVFVVKNV